MLGWLLARQLRRQDLKTFLSARGFDNGTVTEWNGRVQKVPSNLVARLAHV